LDKINTYMKLIELGLNVPKQVKKPQSPGSRGLALNKNQPPKRYYDNVMSKEFSKKTIRQK